MLLKNIFLLLSILLCFNLAAPTFLSKKLRGKLLDIINPNIPLIYNQALISGVTLFKAVVDDVSPLFNINNDVKMYANIYEKYIEKIQHPKEPPTLLEKHQLIEEFQNLVDRNNAAITKKPTEISVLFHISIEKNLQTFLAADFHAKYQMMYNYFNKKIDQFWKGLTTIEKAEHKEFYKWYDLFRNEENPLKKFSEFGDLLKKLEE